mgnify:CR=1 FL=1
MKNFIVKLGNLDRRIIFLLIGLSVLVPLLNPNLINSLEPCLSGWLGHENPFDFSLQYNPASGIDRMRVGTPPVIALAALEASLDIWDTVNINDVRETSIELTDQFINGVEKKCPMLQLITPRKPENRGSQVSFSFEHGYSAMQACIERGVIGDFRAPNVMRFGFTPLFIDSQDVERALENLAEIMSKRARYEVHRLGIPLQQRKLRLSPP